MTSKARYLPRLSLRSIQGAFRPQLPFQRRSFSVYSRSRTDGVYRELTAMRTRVPFIEAFRKQQNGTSKTQLGATETVERDLTPKTMSDSYTRIVSHVT
jgi:acyl-coenzyme A thioesterase 9